MVDKVCVPCDKDYYQPMEMPDSSVSCTKCPNIGGTPQGTEQEQTGSESDCKRKFCRNQFITLLLENNLQCLMSREVHVFKFIVIQLIFVAVKSHDFVSQHIYMSVYSHRWCSGLIQE